MTKQVSLKEVAQKSGVSAAAASRALNDRPGVQPEVRERVKLVAKALGYQPNRSAQSLVSGKASMLGMVIGGPEPGFGSYIGSLVKAVALASAARDQGLALVVDAGDATEAVRRIVSHRQLDGVLVSVVAVGSRLTEELLDAGLPIVLIGTDAAHSNANVVDVENLESSARIVGYLIDNGARRIATITGKIDRTDAIERLQGFRLAHERRNLPVHEELVFEGDFSPSTAYDLAPDLLKHEPDAAFCANDQSASGLYRRAVEFGLAIPDDLSIAGFDGTSSDAFSHPRLTSIVQPFNGIAEAAVDRLLELVDGDSSEPCHTSVEPDLFVGTTTK